MKDKNVAAFLALFFGWLGIHRFYLGQPGRGILYIIFFFFSWIISFVDFFAFLFMDQRTFDLKYNQHAFAYRGEGSITAQQPFTPTVESRSDRQRRYEQRLRERQMREANQRERSANSYVPPPIPGGPRTKSTIQTNRDPGQPEREAGRRYFHDYEFDRAILAFTKALEKNPRDIASHFNIAAAYSYEEQAGKSFYHLDRAVAFGFKDTDRIRTHDAFAFLRVQPEFLAFAKNGFRLAPDTSAAETNLVENQSTVSNTAPPPPTEVPTTEAPATEQSAGEQPAETPLQMDLLDQLQRLAKLREKGLLTEREFTDQKRRLLG